jgi:hypothetical protein
MGTLVGVILVVIALASVVGVMYFVLQEKYVEHEHYIREPKPNVPVSSPEEPESKPE